MSEGQCFTHFQKAALPENKSSDIMTSLWFGTTTDFLPFSHMTIKEHLCNMHDSGLQINFFHKYHWFSLRNTESQTQHKV